MFEKLIEGYIAQGIKDVASDARLAANLFQALPEEEQNRALKWVQDNVDKTQVVLGFRREVPTSPIISVTPSSEIETDAVIGMVGEPITDATTGQRVNLEGSWFEVTYRCLAQAANADVVTYLVAIVRQTMLRYRPQLMNAGLFEQKISMTDLMPSDEFNDPNIEIFQRGVELSGTAFIGYDAVQPDGIISLVATETLTPYASSQADTLVIAAAKITDTFTRADNTSLLRTTSGHVWTPLSGTWGVIANTAYMITPGADHRSLATTTALANGRVSMTVTNPLGSRLGFRFTDKDNGFYVEAQSNQYALVKVLAGVTSTIGTYPVTPASGDQVMASLANSSVSVFVNGTIALAVSQAFNQTGTLHGIGATDTSLAQWTRFTCS